MQEEQTGISKVATILVMTLILAVAATLLLLRITQPFDGYLAFNEAWYSLIAKNYSFNSWLAPSPMPGTIDMNVPPFFSYLLYFFYLILGDAEWGYRLLPVICGVLCVQLTYSIGKNVYGNRAGIAAAALLAVSPVFALAARNVQTDSMYLLCSLAGLRYYLGYRQNNNPGTLVFSAIFFGCGIFAKQFAAVAFLAVIAAEIYCRRSKHFEYKKISPALAAVCIAIVLIIPGHFYIYNAITNPAALFNGQRHGAASLAEIPGLKTLLTLGAEACLGLGPIMCLLALGALIIPGPRRSKFEPFTTIPFISFLAFFIVLHKHSYYALAMAPYLAIIAGKRAMAIKKLTIYSLLLAISLGLGLVHSTMTLGAVKYGYQRFNRVCDRLAAQPGEKTLIVNNSIMSRFEPAIYYYCTSRNGIKIENSASWLKDTKEGLVRKNYLETRYYFLDTQFDGVLRDDSPYFTFYTKKIMGPDIFGYVPYYIPFEKNGRMRTFVPGKIGLARMRGGAFFEMRAVAELPSLVLTELPEGWAVYRKPPEPNQPGPGSIEFRKLF